jgi:hypothetical protein
MNTFYSDHDVKPITDFLKKLTVYEYQKISCFFYFLREQQNIRILVLPEHYYLYQLEAFCKKKKVRTPAEIPQNAGQYYYSTYCGFKGFIVPPEGVKQNTSNLYACGSREAMYSFDKDQVFCFHKNKSKRRKQTRKRSSIEMFTSLLATNNKRLSRDNRKQKQHMLCSMIPLKKISLLGFAIECQEGLLTSCCLCANPALFGINKFEGDKFVCTRCTEKKNLYNEVVCDKCGNIQDDNAEPFAEVQVVDDVRKNPAEFCDIHLCRKCNRAWIKQSGTALRLSVIFKGINEKWRSYKLDQSIALLDPSATKKKPRVSAKFRTKPSKAALKEVTPEPVIPASSPKEVPKNLVPNNGDYVPKRPLKRPKKGIPESNTDDQ